MCHEETGSKICLEGWSGKDCKDRETLAAMDGECPTGGETAGCQNGGTCFDQKCCCLPQYVGDFCEVDLTPCISDPCMHGGTCVGSSDKFECFCPEGWSCV